LKAPFKIQYIDYGIISTKKRFRLFVDAKRRKRKILCFRGTTLFHPVRDALQMPTHLCSVTGVPVCRYPELSRQPLRGEFRKTPTMPRTNRQLSESEDVRVLFRIFAFMINYYSIIQKLCQDI
jgi:hypothetical protein